MHAFSSCTSVPHQTVGWRQAWFASAVARAVNTSKWDKQSSADYRHIDRTRLQGAKTLFLKVRSRRPQGCPSFCTQLRAACHVCMFEVISALYLYRYRCPTEVSFQAAWLHSDSYHLPCSTLTTWACKYCCSISSLCVCKNLYNRLCRGHCRAC